MSDTQTSGKTATRTTEFFVEDSTKNTYKFEEVPAKGQPALIGRLYVQKHVIDRMAMDLGVETIEHLTVTVTAHTPA